jgi:elongation factor Ts
MSKITIDLIQELREKTGLGIMDCKKALLETDGDIAKSIELLRKKGSLIAEKRGNNQTSQGIIYSYIHSGSKIGVLIEINCETDFVANTDVIKTLAHNIAMHVAAMRPLCISESDVDSTVLEKEKEIYTAQLRNEKKPEHIIANIIEGKVKKFYADNCLLYQNFIKNDQMTISDLIKDTIAKVGENVKINRFIRYEIGA